MSAPIGIVAPGIDFHLLGAAASASDYEHVAPRDLDCSGVRAVIVHAFADRHSEWLDAARAASCPVILSCAPSDDAPVPEQGHTEPSCTEHALALTADAYIWRERLLAEALQYVLAEERTHRIEGPLRLVFLGHGGADHTRSAAAPDIGQSFELSAEPLLIGRATQSKVSIKFSTSVARHHAQVTLDPSGQVIVEDLQSTNGTYVRGAQIHGPTAVHRGDEIAVSGFLRLRLDGEAGPS